QPEPAPDIPTKKRKPTAHQAEGAADVPKLTPKLTPKPATNGRKSPPLGPIPPSTLDSDFDEQSLADPSAEMDIQGLDDLDATERFDLGDTVKRSRSRSRDSIVEELDEISDTLALDDSEVLDDVLGVKGRRGSGSKRNGHTPAAN